MSDLRFFVITGMHRSHTSLLANILGESGIKLHSELIDANPSNPYGHFEDAPILRVIENALQDNGAKWFRNIDKDIVVSKERRTQLRLLIGERFQEYGSDWGFKAPHSSLILNTFSQFEEARFIFIYRSPRSVLSSLMRRMGSQLYWRIDVPYLFARAYSIYNNRISDFIEDNEERCHLLSSESLLANPGKEVLRIGQFFNLDLATDKVNEIVKPGTVSGKKGFLEKFYSDRYAKDDQVVMSYERIDRLSQKLESQWSNIAG